MARVALRRKENVEGDFFVDSSCIDCDACRQIAPATFTQRGEQSAVYQQPLNALHRLQAEKALISCPTSSIGTLTKVDLSAAIAAMPEVIDENVHFCGFTSESSFGALSYLVTRPEGNVLIDSPRFTEPLARNIERLGGIAMMLLTHRDDVADHEKFAARFGCLRVLHADDVTSGTRSVEIQPEGEASIEIAHDFAMIPVPGHTKGHAVYLYRNRYLFSGDHLAWSPNRKSLIAFRGACWYSWAHQRESMKKLRGCEFEWVLPGHGRRAHLPDNEMKHELERVIAWM